MRVTYLVNKQVPPVGPAKLDPKSPGTGASRREAADDPRARESGSGRQSPGDSRQATTSTSAPRATARAAGLSSPDPRHPSFTAISWVGLQEVKHAAAMALLRLELLRRQHPARAIARATEFLRCAVGELDALAAGESDEDSEPPARD